MRGDCGVLHGGFSARKNVTGFRDLLSGFHFLVYEGWGMMFIPLSLVFGVLVMLREGFEKPSRKTRKTKW
jgi:hypothetical protein